MQSTLTQKGKQNMFSSWKASAPLRPQKGWFSSLYWEGNCVKAMIEDYGDNSEIEVIGIATVENPDRLSNPAQIGKYTEVYD